MTVYIPTRDRLANLAKILPRWQEMGMPVVLVVEKSEEQETARFARSYPGVTVHSPRKQGMGIGHARSFCVELADTAGERSIIMSDDDLRPAKESPMRLLLRAAEQPGVLGVGATRSYHGLLSQGATDVPGRGLMLCPGGWGMQLFSLNVGMTLECGNFDSRLDCHGEDAELMRQGIARGIPWLVHCSVKCEPIGKRYEPGGLNAYIRAKGMGTRTEREVACQALTAELWPGYVAAPPKRPRVAWGKLYDDYIPGWRALSAIHGGKF